MTININELRLLAQDCKLAGSPVFVRVAVMDEILDRLEAAEKERDNYKFALSAYSEKTEWVQQSINDGTVSPKYLGWHRADAMTDLLEAAERKAEMLHQLLDAHRKDHAVIQEQNSRLRAEIEAMKQQEPVKYEIRRKPRQDNTGSRWKQTYRRNIDRMPSLDVCSDDLFDYEVRALYLAPGEQPAPSVPDGWLRAIDEALVVAHIGVANAEDTYEQAKAKLDNLIGFLVDVATDPAVNGGYKLVPIEPTPEMIRALIDGVNQYASWNEGYRDMLAAAPEVKP